MKHSEESQPFFDEGVPSRRSGCWQSALSFYSVLMTIVALIAWYREPIKNTKIAPEQDICVWPTDFKAAQSAIVYETRHFSNTLDYDLTTKEIIRNLKPDDVRYFGAPSKAIDDAWESLLHNEWPPMTDEEAAPFLPELTKLPVDHRYHFEPDVFHSLHCLNAVRKHIDKDQYVNETPIQTLHQHGFTRLHIDHCLDQIRQAVMCHGDLSPTPLYSASGFAIALGKGSAHTCRKWEPIRAWVDERNREMNNTLYSL